MENSLNKKGLKSKNLEVLRKNLYNIPDFLSLSEDISRDELSLLIKKLDPRKSYILRSDSVLEDLAGSSFAGYFMSLGELSLDDILPSFDIIQNDALAKIGVKIPCIIQEWIKADYSGVAFSREPLSDSYSPLVEWSKGSAEKNVSGRNIPYQLRLNDSFPRKKKILFEKIFSDLKKFEKIVDGPVDVEWLVRGDILFYVQLRPAENKHEFSAKQLSDLDHLISGKNYHYVLGGGSQVLMYDNSFNQSLLNSLYRKDGPIFKAHEKMSIHFNPIQPYVGFNGYLYLDVQKELHQTAESFSYKKKNLKSLKISHKGIFTTLKNIYYFAKISTKTDIENSTWDNIKIALSRKWNISSKEDLFEMYDFVYELIVSLGLYAAHGKITKGPNFDIAGFFASKSLEVGNSMDVCDTSSTLWNRSSFAGTYDNNSLREIARLLSVFLRKETEIFLKNSSSIGISQPILKKSPGLISDLAKAHQKNTRLSEGSISGSVIFTMDDVSKFRDPVLYVEFLSPDLVDFFPLLAGVITKNGGLLSHLSIVAREQNFPIMRSNKVYDFGEKVDFT